jgi:ketosteroid isomerase-like protein
MSERDTVQRLADLEAIRDLPRRYAHAVWLRDAAAAASLFAEDGVMDTGDDALEGRASILEIYTTTFAASEFRPFVHQHVIDLEGDRATGTCYMDVRANVDGVAMFGFGYYEDRYIREADGWKFARRKLNLVRYSPEAPGVP